MKKLLDRAGADCVEVRCADFLSVDPDDEAFSQVEYIMVDPSVGKRHVQKIESNIRLQESPCAYQILKT